MRKTGRKAAHAVAGLLGAALCALALVGAASADHDPSYNGTAETHFVVGGNPGCPKGTSLVKIDPAAAGVFGDGAVEVYDLVDGKTFSWRLTSSGADKYDMAAVIVKGGPVEAPDGEKAASVVFTYDSGSGGNDDSDTGLSAPIGADGKRYDISHIEFCVDPKDGGSASDLLVSKTASTEWEKVVEWNVEKTVDQPSLSLTAPNGTGKVTWKIVVDQTGSSARNARVFGTITVSNPNDSDVSGVAVTDSLAGAVVDCDAKAEGNQSTDLTVPGKGKLECTYSAAVPSATSGTNTATATAKLGEDDVTGTGSTGYAFGEPKKVINGSVSAEDSSEQSWSEITQNSTFTYDETFRCPSTGRTNVVVLRGDNPATEQVETNYVLDQSSATVVVTCGSTPPPVTPPPVTPQPTPLIDVQVVKDATAQVTLGSNGTAEIAYTVVVKNNGPNQANNVVLADAAPAGVVFKAITKQPDFGSCSITPSVLQCNLGSMGFGVQTTISWTATVSQTGTIVNTATAAGSGATDTNTGNNTDDARTVVVAPVTPPTPKPKPQPQPKPQPKPVAICLKLAVKGTSAVTAGKGTVAFKVTRSGKPVAGVGVVIKGAGIFRVAKTNAAGVVTARTISEKSGIVTATITPAKKGCNSARVGVIGIFEPPVTG